MGLVMAKSGCSQTDHFKPMVRFHVPLETAERTLYRAISIYLLAQYLVNEVEGESDLKFEGPTKIYENLQTLNSAMADRVRSTIEKDAAVNTIAILDVFAISGSFDIQDQLKDIQHFFAAYFE